MKHIDLHIHSTFSDGTYTPEEIVKEAREKKLDLISLTDHNSFAGLIPFQEACKKYNQKAIAGIEMTTAYRNEEPHILGYFPLETTRSQLKDIIMINRSLMKLRDLQLEAIIINLSEEYPQVSVKGFYSFIASLKTATNYNRVHLCQYLISLNLCHNINEGFEHFVGEETPYYVKKKNTSYLTAIDAIHKCGGKAIVAHAGEYHLDVSLKQFVEDMEDAGIDGFELFHPHNNEAFIKELLEYTHCPIIYTCGSDFHGKNKINVMGIPYFYDMEQSELKDYYEMTCNNAYHVLYKENNNE